MALNLKDTMSNVFVALKDDEELLSLLKVPTRDMKDIKKQLIEDRYPDGLVQDNLSRLCIYETPSSPTMNPNVERGWVEIDIYVTKENNRIDRRILLIAKRIIEVLDEKERVKRGKSPVQSGVNLSYYNRLPNMFTDNESWIKHGLVFSYDYIRV